MKEWLETSVYIIELRVNKGTLETSNTREFDSECSIINTRVNN
jgi:hypothetical protein